MVCKYGSFRIFQFYRRNTQGFANMALDNIQRISPYLTTYMFMDILFLGILGEFGQISFIFSNFGPWRKLSCSNAQSFLGKKKIKIQIFYLHLIVFFFFLKKIDIASFGNQEVPNEKQFPCRTCTSHVYFSVYPETKVVTKTYLLSEWILLWYY